MRTAWMLVGLVACGMDGKLVVDLDDGEREKLCDELAPETFTCEDVPTTGIAVVEITIGCDDPADFDALPASCELTVGEYKDCDAYLRDAARENPCGSDTTTATLAETPCEPLFACYGQ